MPNCGYRPAQIAQLQRRLGVTTVYVTHDQVEAMTMGDRVAVLNSGVLQQCASPRELYAKPDNLFVAGFIGSPAMNLFPCRWGRWDPGQAAPASRCRHPVSTPIRWSWVCAGGSGHRRQPVGAASPARGRRCGRELARTRSCTAAPNCSATRFRWWLVPIGAIRRTRDRLSLAVDIARVHLFSTITGKRL